MENIVQENNPKSKKNKKKTISNVIFLILLTILVIILICSIGEINKIAQVFNEAITNGWPWLLGALALTILYFALWPLSQCIYAKSMKCKTTVGDSYLIACSEHFYNGITPFSAGGQPFQVYSYTKRKVTTADATGIILASFVTFMMVTNAFAIVSLFFWQDIYNGLKILNQQSLIFVALIGFIINFAVLIFMIMLGTNKKIRNILVALLTKIANAKLFHNPKHKLLNKFGNFLVKQLPNFETYCDNAQIAFKEIYKHKLATVFSLIIKIIAMASFYAIPFFLIKSCEPVLGVSLSFDKLPLVLFATSFAITSVVWVPTPGGTGGNELAFTIVIAAAIASTNQSGAAAVALLWRLFTFYLIIIASFIANVIFEAITNKKMKKEEQNV